MSETFFTRKDNGESRACLLLNYEYLKLLYKLKRNYACVRAYFFFPEGGPPGGGFGGGGFFPPPPPPPRCVPPPPTLKLFILSSCNIASFLFNSSFAVSYKLDMFCIKILFSFVIRSFSVSNCLTFASNCSIRSAWCLSLFSNLSRVTRKLSRPSSP